MTGQNYIYDCNRTYYAGMTAEQAKANGTYRSFWSRDFKNIDKNKDGVLSVNEIMKERKRTVRGNYIVSAIAAGFAVLDICTNKSKVWLAVGLAIDALLGITSFLGAKAIQKENKIYEGYLKNQNNRVNFTT